MKKIFVVHALLIITLALLAAPGGAQNQVNPKVATEGIVVYDNTNFGGASQVLTSDVANFTTIAIGNDAVSSVRVPTGWSVTLFLHSDYAGTSVTTSTDIADMGLTVVGDNQVSSCRISPPGIDGSPGVTGGATDKFGGPLGGPETTDLFSTTAEPTQSSAGDAPVIAGGGGYPFGGLTGGSGEFDPRSLIPFSENSSAEASISASGKPGFVLAWLSPDQSEWKAWLPLGQTGTTPQGVGWNTELKSNYGIPYLDLNLTLSEDFTAGLSSGRHTVYYWLQDENGNKSNKRWEYMDVDLPQTEDRGLELSGPRELVFKGMISTYSQSSRSLTKVSSGQLLTVVNEETTAVRYFSSGRLEFTVPAVEQSKLIVSSGDLLNDLVFSFSFDDQGLLHINRIRANGAIDNWSVIYYELADGSFQMEYYRDRVYICGPGDQDGPILGMIYKKK